MTSKNRVAHFVTSLEMGGVTSLVKLLAAGLPQEKYKVFICALSDDNNKGAKQRNGDIQYVIIRSNGLNNISIIFKIIRFLKDNEIEIVHTHPGFLSRFAATLAKVPVIVSTWHGTLPRSRVRLRFFDRYLANRTSMFVANSYFTKNENSAALGLSERHSQVIYNGIDLDRFGYRDEERGRQARRELGIPLEATVVSATGRLHPDKGHDVLIAAANLVVKTEPKVYFVVAGDGKWREMLETTAARMGINNHVRIIGAVDDVRPLLWASNLFVQPSSRREGFGLSLVEAMAVGLPVVGSDLGGIPEIIEAEVNGLLAPPGNSSMLASQIIRLIKDPELSAKLGRNGQCTVSEKFVARRMVRQYMDLYMELLQRGTD